MNRLRMRRLAFEPGLLFSFVTMTSCSSNDEANGLLTAPVTEVSVTPDNRFSPASVHVKKDDVVRWTWSGGLHNVVSGQSCTPDGQFSSGPEATSGSFERKFETVGTFPYFCTPHCDMGMTGEVIVEP
jgi:plastocyanin